MKQRRCRVLSNKTGGSGAHAWPNIQTNFWCSCRHFWQFFCLNVDFQSWEQVFSVRYYLELNTSLCIQSKHLITATTTFVCTRGNTHITHYTFFIFKDLRGKMFGYFSSLKNTERGYDCYGRAMTTPRPTVCYGARKSEGTNKHSQSESLLKLNFIVPATNQPTNKDV